MSFILGNYQNEDTRQQTIDILTNIAEAMAGTKPPTGFVIDRLQSESKTYTGIYAISILNIGDIPIEVDGVELLPGEPPVSANTIDGGLLKPITINCTNVGEDIGKALVTYTEK